MERMCVSIRLRIEYEEIEREEVLLVRTITGFSLLHDTSRLCENKGLDLMLR